MLLFIRSYFITSDKLYYTNHDTVRIIRAKRINKENCVECLHS